jgi:ABC-type Fe3+ transport system permease subunit
MNNASLESYLSPGEKLLWSGAPKKKFRVERRHLPMFLILLPFLAIMLLPVIAILIPENSSNPNAGSTQAQTPPQDQSGAHPPAKKPTLAARIFLAAFFLFFFGAIAVSVVYSLGYAIGGNTFLQGETQYCVTNQRLIVVAGKKQKTIRSIHLGTATDVRMKEWPDGLGSISFGPEPMWPYATSLRTPNTLLENIAEPRKVFQLIIEARKSA